MPTRRNPPPPPPWTERVRRTVGRVELEWSDLGNDRAWRLTWLTHGAPRGRFVVEALERLPGRRPRRRELAAAPWFAARAPLYLASSADADALGLAGVIMLSNMLARLRELAA